MTTEHDDQCEQRATIRWTGCLCEQRAATSEAIEAWVVECRESVGS